MNIFEINVKSKSNELKLIPYKTIDWFDKLLRYNLGIDDFYLSTNDKSIYINENCEFFRIDYLEHLFLYLNSDRKSVV